MTEGGGARWSAALSRASFGSTMASVSNPPMVWTCLLWGGGGLVGVYGGRDRADEGDGVHARMGQHPVGGLLVAVQNLSHAVRQASTLRRTSTATKKSPSPPAARSTW